MACRAGAKVHKLNRNDGRLSVFDDWMDKTRFMENVKIVLTHIKIGVVQTGQ